MSSKNNALYRKPNCPYGKKAVELLNSKSISFEDNIFADKAEEEAFKEEHGVSTTPQVFLEGERIGGYSDLADKLGESPSDTEETSYTPVIAVFTTTALMAFATGTSLMGFMGFSLCTLALLKLMDLSSFVESFKAYDLITQRISSYGKVYPFLELLAGLGFLAGLYPIATGTLSTLVGVAGGISVIKAVYIDKKDLNCACVGGNSNVPLGIISFSENAMMAFMGLYLLFF